MLLNLLNNNTTCNPVAPVPNGIPVYNHEGCISEYIVNSKNTVSNNGGSNTVGTTISSGGNQWSSGGDT